MLREAPDLASPRTAWSTHNRKELSTWASCHARLVSDASTYVPAADKRNHVVLFGDSITESFRGTSYGKPVPRTRGVPGVLNSTIAARWPALPLGIAADCTQHLLWRLQHGELSRKMAADPRLLSVMLIGTNNLGHAHTVDETVRGVIACATHLHALGDRTRLCASRLDIRATARAARLNATRGQLLVNALLPRGDRRRRGRKGKASGFMADVLAVNTRLSASVRGSLEAAFPRRVRYVDCGAPFLVESARASTDLASESVIIRRELMPDKLHPNAAGQLLWARCMESALIAMAAPS